MLSRCVFAYVVFCGLSAMLSSEANAQRTKASTKKTTTKESAAVSGPRDVRSKNFLVHTDLADDDAADLINRLETMLKLISTYWGRPNPQPIECYVVKDLEMWPP